MLSEAKRKSNDKYIKSHYSRLNISYANDKIARIKEAAGASGQSIAQYVWDAVVARMEKEGM